MNSTAQFEMFQQSMPEPDLSRGRNNPRSQKAWDRARVTAAEWRQRIHAYVEQCGARGGWLAEFCRREYVDKNVVSGRFTECCKGTDGLWIYRAGRTQEGCGVYVIRREWAGSSDREER